MSDYDSDVRTLEAELTLVEQVFRGLAAEDWHRPTLLRPLDETKPPWTRAPCSQSRVSLRASRCRDGLSR